MTEVWKLCCQATFVGCQKLWRRLRNERVGRQHPSSSRRPWNSCFRYKKCWRMQQLFGFRSRKQLFFTICWDNYLQTWQLSCRKPGQRLAPFTVLYWIICTLVQFWIHKIKKIQRRNHRIQIQIRSVQNAADHCFHHANENETIIVPVFSNPENNRLQSVYTFCIFYCPNSNCSILKTGIYDSAHTALRILISDHTSQSAICN